MPWLYLQPICIPHDKVNWQAATLFLQSPVWINGAYGEHVDNVFTSKARDHTQLVGRYVHYDKPEGMNVCLASYKAVMLVFGLLCLQLFLSPCVLLSCFCRIRHCRRTGLLVDF